jgi:hypothetical protein
MDRLGGLAHGEGRHATLYVFAMAVGAGRFKASPDGPDEEGRHLAAMAAPVFIDGHDQPLK